MKIREGTPFDIEAIRDKSISRGIMKQQEGKGDFIYTLEHQGLILGVGGIRMINDVSAWGWVTISEDAKVHIIPCYRILKEYMELIVKEMGIIRLQAYVDPDFPEAIRMIQHLGFEKESVLENFLPNGNAFLYKRIFKENI